MRCYHGAPDAQLQAVLDHRAALRRAVQQVHGAGARVVYFPVEQAWQVYGAHHLPLGAMCADFEKAVHAALESR